MTDDIPRARLTQLRGDLVKDQGTHLANLNSVIGAIQAIDLLLTPEPAQAAATGDGLEVSTE